MVVTKSDKYLRNEVSRNMDYGKFCSILNP